MNTKEPVLTFKEAVKLCYSFNCGHQIIVRGTYNSKTTPVDFRAGEGKVSGSYGFEAQIVEVEVNKKHAMLTSSISGIPMTSEKLLIQRR